jgi:hypothetical protein
MRGLEGEQELMRIFIGSGRRGTRRPLDQDVLGLLRAEGLGGAAGLPDVRGEPTTRAHPARREPLSRPPPGHTAARAAQAVSCFRPMARRCRSICS